MSDGVDGVSGGAGGVAGRAGGVAPRGRAGGGGGGLSAVWLLAGKDLRAIGREKTALIFTVFLPLFIGIAFGLIFSGGGGSGGVPVLVRDGDGTAASGRFVALLGEHGALEVSLVGDEFEAERLVRSGSAAAAVLIDGGFGGGVDTMLLGDPPGVRVLVDPSRRAERALLEGVLAERSMRLLSERLTDPRTRVEALGRVRSGLESATGLGAGERLALVAAIDQLTRGRWGGAEGAEGAGGAGDGDGDGDGVGGVGGGGFVPLRTEIREVGLTGDGGGGVRRPPSAFHVTFAMAMVWAIMGCSATFAVSLVTERVGGTLLRLRAAPIGGLAIVGGKALACFVASVVVAGVMLGIGVAWFGVRPVSWWWLGVAVVAGASAFAGIMMLLSVLGSNKSSASQLAWAVMLLMAVPGGGMLPLIAMPEWLASIGRFSPMRWAILGIEGGLWRGFGMAEMVPIVGVLAVFAGCSFAAGVWLFRWSDGSR